MFLGVDEVYVINLKRHSLRKSEISKHFKDITFIDAIDWKNYLNLQDLHSYLGGEFYDPNGWFSYGIICCALSHRKAWKKFIDSNQEYALFLEDDVIPTKFIDNFDFNQLNQDLKKLDWGVCFLGKYNESNTVSTHVLHNLYNYDYFNHKQYAAHAYILNKKSAKWFYSNTEKIKYAADFRLEISPFTNLIVKNSLFIQKYRELKPNLGQVINTPLMEFFHHTTEDVAEGEEWGWIEQIHNTRHKTLVVNKNLPIKSIKIEEKNFKNKKIKGYNFNLYE